MVIISPEIVDVLYDSTVALTCVVHSLVTPNITWTSNTNVTLHSTSVVSNDDNSIYISNLTLEQVTLDNIGEYTCTAENEGGVMSDMTNVIVYGKNMSLSICMSVI